jgi:hypothetical protein
VIVPDPDNWPVTWAVEGLELDANARWVFGHEPTQLKVPGNPTAAPAAGLVKVTVQAEVFDT